VGAYCTATEFRAYAFEADPSEDARYSTLCEGASRLFDLLVGCEPDTFAKAGGDAGDAVFYGDGTDYLQVDSYVPGSLTTVALPDGYTVPDYVERDGYLIRTYGGDGLRASAYEAGSASYLGAQPGFEPRPGWPAGVPVTVTARWGYPSVPADVKLAVALIAIWIWRGGDPAGLKATGFEELRQAGLPELAVKVISVYARRNSFVFA